MSVKSLLLYRSPCSRSAASKNGGPARVYAAGLKSGLSSLTSATYAPLASAAPLLSVHACLGGTEWVSRGGGGVGRLGAAAAATAATAAAASGGRRRRRRQQQRRHRRRPAAAAPSARSTETTAEAASGSGRHVPLGLADHVEHARLVGRVVAEGRLLVHAVNLQLVGVRQVRDGLGSLGGGLEVLGHGGKARGAG